MMHPLLQQLFQPQSNQPNLAPNPFVTKGSLIMFRYSFWIHDPVPLVIVTDYTPAYRIRGVNLHYLTYSYISNLLTSSAGMQGFSYQNIKGDSYISSAFRSYKWQGISQVKKFDAQFILKAMSVARNFDPTQIQAIRQSVEQQLQQQYVPKAQETVEQPYGVQPTNIQT